MQLKTDVGSALWIIAPLIVVAVGMAVILYIALPLPGARLGGGFFLAIGVMNTLFYKRTGQKMFARGRSSWAFVARFWICLGENGTQFLFLGIGVILAVAGCILLAAGAA